MSISPYRYLPSLLCADQLHLGDNIEELLSLGFSALHYDVMDNRYVPNLALSYDLAEQIAAVYPNIALDAHLMTEHTERAVERMAICRAKRIAFHLMKNQRVNRLINLIRLSDAQVGIALNPSEPLSLALPYLPDIDYLLIMGIRPGFSGRKFIKSTVDKVKEAVALRAKDGFSYTITVDGGITSDIGAKLFAAGADAIVLGYPTIFRQPDGITKAWARCRACLSGYEGSEPNETKP